MPGGASFRGHARQISPTCSARRQRGASQPKRSDRGGAGSGPTGSCRHASPSSPSNAASPHRASSRRSPPRSSNGRRRTTRGGQSSTARSCARRESGAALFLAHTGPDAQHVPIGMAHVELPDGPRLVAGLVQDLLTGGDTPLVHRVHVVDEDRHTSTVLAAADLPVDTEEDLDLTPDHRTEPSRVTLGVCPPEARSEPDLLEPGDARVEVGDVEDGSQLDRRHAAYPSEDALALRVTSTP